MAEYLHACNFTLAKLPRAKSSNELHHLTYKCIRKTSFLASDIIQEARKDIWAKRKKIKGKITNASIRLNKRWFKYVFTQRDNPVFKITYSPRKCFSIPVATDRQYQRFKQFISDGWLFDNISLLKDGRIAVVLEKEFPAPHYDCRYALGIDIGSSTLATVSVFDTVKSKTVKQLYFGRDVAVRQKRYARRRSYLQSLADKGSQRAYKSLKRLKNSQFNFVKTRSGQISKEIAKLAKKYGASIAIEKLKNVRGRRGKFRKQANSKISRIPYGLFKQFLKSNAEMLGIGIQEVDAYHTSKWCPSCGAINDGHKSGNYALYKCRKCGLIMNSDRKASLAIAIKSLLERNKTHDFSTSVFFQFSNRRVPVNGLLRSNEVGLSNVAVQHTYQPMESPL
ncbi:MAG: transposase [Candidatus Micrarchaeota archaeon]